MGSHGINRAFCLLPNTPLSFNFLARRGQLSFSRRSASDCARGKHQKTLAKVPLSVGSRSSSHHICTIHTQTRYTLYALYARPTLCNIPGTPYGLCVDFLEIRFWNQPHINAITRYQVNFAELCCWTVLRDSNQTPPWGCLPFVLR